MGIEMNDTIQVNFRISQKQLKQLKRLARILSVKKDKDILYTDLAREGIDVILKKYSNLLENWFGEYWWTIKMKIMKKF